MPIFEYKCEECSKKFSKLVFNSSEKIECPGCGSGYVEKQMSMVSTSHGKGSEPASCGGPTGFS